jgi:DNA polymerase-3 subunit gamma/tau
MSYQVIARKYRPQRFSDVVGQDHVTRTLSHAVEQNRIAHAYLFCGPRGTGKTTIARIFAKCLNCTGGPKAEFDPEDPKCKEIADGRSLDVLEIDGASNNGVEQVRELRETCKYAPASSKFKIYIIDEVHMLSTAAFNALLKTLEEPPEHVKFMFATTEPEKVLATILSRCQRFDLRRIPSALIVKHLAHIAALEHVNVDPAALHAIARGAEGGMRDAESTLDQLISFCGERIEEADVLSMFGLAAQSQLLRLARAVLDGEVEEALRQLDELSRHGKDLGRLLTDLLNHFRNLLLFRASQGDLNLIEASEAEVAALREQSALTDVEALTRILEVLTGADVRLRDTASKRILLEVALLKAMDARKAVSLDLVLRKLQELRGDNSAAAPPERSQESPPQRRAVSPAHSADAAPAVRKQASPAAPQSQAGLPAAAAPPTGSDLAELWVKLVESLGRASPFVRSYFLEAHPVSFAKNVFVIGFDPEVEDHIGLVDNPRNHALLQTKLSELGHPGAQIKFVKAEAPAKPPAAASEPPIPASAPAAANSSGGSAPAPARSAPATRPQGKDKPVSVPFSKDDFKNDPLIQKALEVFKGQIVEVKA